MSRLSGLFLLAVLMAPIAVVCAAVLQHPTAAADHGLDRITGLFLRSLALCGGSLAVALPIGIAVAAVLYRRDRPWLRPARAMMLVLVFVPLPLTAIAWQGLFGSLATFPWATGLPPAIAVHAVAAVPWVAWIVGSSLRRIPAELLDDARSAASPWSVFLRVELPLVRPAVVTASAVTMAQAFGEITVTDFMVVRTFAEEVYQQYVTAGDSATASAGAIVAIPMLMMSCLVVWGSSRATGGLPTVRPLPSERAVRQPNDMLHVIAGWGMVGVLAGVPLASLLMNAAGQGSVAGVSLDRLARELSRAIRLHGGMVADSALWAAVSAVIAVGCAVTVARWATGVTGAFGAPDTKHATRRTWRIRVALGAAAILWVIPGPLLGFAVKESIRVLMDFEELLLGSAGPVRTLFHDGGYPTPVVWVHVLRAFPFALAFVWPAVRAVPQHLRESARMDGAGRWQAFRLVEWPAIRGAVGFAVAACSAMSLGELSAGKIVQVPGRLTFCQELFNQMHYGSGATVSALALVLLTSIAVVWGGLGRLFRVGIGRAVS